MSEQISSIFSKNSMSFMLNSMGGYFCCILPRFEIPIWIKTLESFINNEDKTIKQSFKTPSISGKIYCLGSFVIIEAEAKEGTNKFRMMLELEVSQQIIDLLTIEYENSLRVFKAPSPISFSWQIYSVEPKEENEIKNEIISLGSGLK